MPPKTTENQSKVALAFVGSAQHVMDYPDRNGWMSITDYSRLLSVIETQGAKANSTILYTLVRTSTGYRLKNKDGGYLKAPSSNDSTHEWTNTESEAADLEIEACPEGCTYGNAVNIKTTVNSTVYYFSANKPAKWRTNANDYQKAIYMFNWVGNNH